MKREAKLLLDKASDSLVLGVELFNHPHDRGRVSAVLIQTDHAFEMFLKAAIIQKGGKIRESGAKETIGLDACVRRGLSNGNIKFLTGEQALTIQAINGLRDAAQHYLLDISEAQLYIHVQSGVTLFRDLLMGVFQKELSHELPTRVLPVSTIAPIGIEAMFDREIEEIMKLLQPGKRRTIEAEARLRPLAVLDSTVRGEKGQPSTNELNRIGRSLLKQDWKEVFVGAGLINVVTEGSGPTISIRMTKRDGPPIHVVPEGTSGTSPVAVRRVNELDFYSLGAKELSHKLGLMTPKLLAVLAHCGIQDDPDCFKQISVGGTHYKRYSQKAIWKLSDALSKESLDDIWNNRPNSMRKRRNGSMPPGSSIAQGL